MDSPLTEVLSRSGTPSEGDRTPRTRMAKRLLAAYIALTVFQLAFRGIPFDRRFVALWVIVAFTIHSLGVSPREARRTLVRWSPFMAVVVAHELGGAFSDNFGRPTVVHLQLRIDRFLGGGNVPTTWLQQRLHATGRVHWYDAVVAVVYLSYFIAPYAVAAFLWKVDRSAWKRYTAVYFTLAATAFVTWSAFPTAPPWMAADQGLIPATPRLVNDGWHMLGLKAVSFFVIGGQKAANEVAAIPSLHGAHSLMVAWFLWSRVSPRWRPLLAVYPFAMMFSLVYGGEHYVIDVLVGWAYLVFAVVLVNAVARKWEAAAEIRLARRGQAADVASDLRPHRPRPRRVVPG